MTYQESLKQMREHTGIVIPVYFPAGTGAEFAHALLSETTQSFAREVSAPQQICLSVDGSPEGGRAAERVAAETGVLLIRSERNRGKLHSVRRGMLELLKNPALQFLVIADQDGDHFANELLNLVRGALHVQAAAQEGRVLVLGRRISRHRSMGFLRGELEELADRMLLDALAWHAARTGQPLRMEFSSTLDEYPDFHSGYKLLTRPVAKEIFQREPELAGLPEDAGFRHGVEAVICVEAILAGAILASVNRSTLDEQPLSAFGLLHRGRMVADKILWPCKRLEVPAPFVAQWMANHLPRLMLGTLRPQGVQELLEVQRLVLSGYGLKNGTGPAAEADPTDITRPRFI